MYIAPLGPCHRLWEIALFYHGLTQGSVLTSSPQDMVVILFSSVGNCFRSNRPSSSGYTRAGGDSRGGFIGAIGGRGGGHGGRRDVDAENRLIDQLDEEWDD